MGCIMSEVSTGLMYGLVHKHQIDYVNVIVVDLWGKRTAICENTYAS